jgi:hypothetical protein
MDVNNRESSQVTLRSIKSGLRSDGLRARFAGQLLVIVPRLLTVLILFGFGLCLLGFFFGLAGIFAGSNWPRWLQGGAEFLTRLTGSERWFVWLLWSIATLAASLLLISLSEYLVEFRDRRTYERAGLRTLYNTFRPFFDTRWALLEHVALPDLKDRIDAILVGPTGLYLLETSAHPGYNLVRGDTWYRWRWGKWISMRLNPSRRARQQARALTEMLRSAGIPATVETRVVWLGPGRLTVERSNLEIWKLSDIELAIEALKRLKSLRQNEVEDIVACLAGDGVAQ